MGIEGVLQARRGSRLRAGVLQARRGFSATVWGVPGSTVVLGYSSVCLWRAFGNKPALGSTRLLGYKRALGCKWAFGYKSDARLGNLTRASGFALIRRKIMKGDSGLCVPSPTCGPTCASAGPTCAPAGPTCGPREARAAFLHTSPASPDNPSSHLGMVELLSPRIVPSTISQHPCEQSALALGGAVSANINPSSHVSMVEFGAATAMIGLSIPALTWGRCSRLCRTPYHGRPEYGSFLNFVWLNKPCEATPRIRMPLRWRAES